VLPPIVFAKTTPSNLDATWLANDVTYGLFDAFEGSLLLPHQLCYDFAT
jgi:hypothetical protein